VELKGEFTSKQGRLSGPSPLRSDGSRDHQTEKLSCGEKQLNGGHQSPLGSNCSRDGQAGRLDGVSGGQNALKTKLNKSQKGIPGTSPLRSDGFLW
jgi:hypothetical protein